MKKRLFALVLLLLLLAGCTAAPEADHNAVLCTAVDTALFKQRMYALLGAK